MKNCPFCSPDVHNSVFARSDNFLAIYNIAPVLPGHSLIIPKKHIESILVLTEAEMLEMTLFAGKVTRLLLHVFKSDGFNWSIQDSEAAGQSLAHLHVHIIPRLNGDLPKPGDWYPLIQNNYSEILDSQKRQRLSISQMQKIVTCLREEASQMGLFHN
jgi:bis(5'-adenosyl)-triphosphatase